MLSDPESFESRFCQAPAVLQKDFVRPQEFCKRTSSDPSSFDVGFFPTTTILQSDGLAGHRVRCGIHVDPNLQFSSPSPVVVATFQSFNPPPGPSGGMALKVQKSHKKRYVSPPATEGVKIAVGRERCGEGRVEVGDGEVGWDGGEARWEGG